MRAEAECPQSAAEKARVATSLHDHQLRILTIHLLYLFIGTFATSLHDHQLRILTIHLLLFFHIFTVHFLCRGHHSPRFACCEGRSQACAVYGQDAKGGLEWDLERMVMKL